MVFGFRAEKVRSQSRPPRTPVLKEIIKRQQKALYTAGHGGLQGFLLLDKAGEARARSTTWSQAKWEQGIGIHEPMPGKVSDESTGICRQRKKKRKYGYVGPNCPEGRRVLWDRNRADLLIKL